MDTYLTVMVNPFQTIVVEGYNMSADEHGAVSIIIDEMMKLVRGNPLSTFEQYVDEKMTREQAIQLYTLFSEIHNITLKTITDIVGITREQVRELVIIATRCKILKRSWNSTWKVISKDIANKCQVKVDELSQSTSKSSSSSKYSAIDILQSHLKTSRSPSPIPRRKKATTR